VLTPQDVKNKEFTKAVFGGYDMAAVDDFLEILVEDYSSLYKENAILKNKLKVLVEKVEEYRSTEDAMRMALLTAQKMSREMMDEATNKSKNIVEEAEYAARSKIEELRLEVREEELRLEAAKKTTADFVAMASELCQKQQDFLADVEKLTVPGESEPVKPRTAFEQAEKAQNPFSSIEESVARIYENTIRSEDAGRSGYAEPEAEEDTEPEEEQRNAADEKTKVFPSVSSQPAPELDDMSEPTSPKPKFNFTNLQFGSNYDQNK
jgi:cell division initiation protein